MRYNQTKYWVFNPSSISILKDLWTIFPTVYNMTIMFATFQFSMSLATNITYNPLTWLILVKILIFIPNFNFDSKRPLNYLPNDISMIIFNGVQFSMISTTKNCLKSPKKLILVKVLSFVFNVFFDSKRPLNYITIPYLVTFLQTAKSS